MRSGEAVSRAAVFGGAREELAPVVERVAAVAAEAGVEIVDDGAPADVAVVLGGDGTMLRALRHFLGLDVPSIGVNFGRVGFLTSIEAGELDESLRRVFRGDYVVFELPTLEATSGDQRRPAVNDVVATSGILGRMIELGWSVGGEDLGILPCDGLVCATPSGSTAYNLSSGGPVLVWGLDAMAITFVAPHSLHARPLVVPRDRELVVTNRTDDVPVTLLTDGQPFAQIEPGSSVVVRLDDARTLLATLPEATFFRRYRETFGS